MSVGVQVFGPNLTFLPLKCLGNAGFQEIIMLLFLIIIYRKLPSGKVFIAR